VINNSKETKQKKIQKKPNKKKGNTLSSSAKPHITGQIIHMWTYLANTVFQIKEREKKGGKKYINTINL